MPDKFAAHIRDGVVVNVSSYDEGKSEAWLNSAKDDFDEIRIVSVAGVGWTVEEEGLRPPKPFGSWSWNGSEWEAPIERPGPGYYWDEDAIEWVYDG